MKKIFLSLCGGLLLTFLVPTVTLAKTPTTASLQNKAQVLFVLLAKEGTIHEVIPGQYQLTLNKVNPEIIYFAERPARFANHVNVAEFIKQWQTGTFKADPPNAVIQAIRITHNGAFERQKHTVNYAIVLKNPTYNKVTDQLHFDIKRLSGNTSALPVIASSDYLALFVDGACLSCF
jgi:hypothetical protein